MSETLPKPLRVLTLATLFPSIAKPNFGIFVQRQTAALAARDGVDITVINPIGIAPWPFGEAHPDVPEQEEYHGLMVYRPRFFAVPKIGGPLNPGMIARAVLPLAKRLHDENPFDVIDAEFFYPDGPAAMRIAGALNIPFTVKARGADIHYWGQATGCRGQILQAARRASGLLAVAGSLRDDMVALGIDADKIMVHYTGLDKTRFALRNRAEEKAKLGITGPLVLSIGALIPRKNQDIVIRALVDLPGVTLMLAGLGEAEASYRALAQQCGVADRVRFLGAVPHDDLPAICAAADVMALVSKSEGLANAWVEALACGTPIVASNVGGAPELIRSPSAGRIVDQTPTAVAAAITDLIHNPVPPERVTAQIAQFSWDENARLLERFFRTITEA